MYHEPLSTKGNLGIPKLNPILFKADLTGIGLTSENKSVIKGILSSCIFLASSKLPLKKFQIISWVNFGLIFDKTEITPKPPKEQIGIAWSSLPE